MKKGITIAAAVVLVASVAGLLYRPDQAPPPAIDADAARDALQSEYALAVPDPVPECDAARAGARVFVRCGPGLWEASGSTAALTLAALNGPALRVLDTIAPEAGFVRGSDPAAIDAARAAFEG